MFYSFVLTRQSGNCTHTPHSTQGEVNIPPGSSGHDCIHIGQKDQGLYGDLAMCRCTVHNTGHLTMCRCTDALWYKDKAFPWLILHKVAYISQQNEDGCLTETGHKSAKTRRQMDLSLCKLSSCLRVCAAELMKQELKANPSTDGPIRYSDPQIICSWNQSHFNLQSKGFTELCNLQSLHLDRLYYVVTTVWLFHRDNVLLVRRESFKQKMISYSFPLKYCDECNDSRIAALLLVVYHWQPNLQLC